MLKRLACLLLTGLIVLTLLPTAVFAEDEEQPIITNEEQTETTGGTQTPVTGEPEQQDALSSDTGLNAAEEQPVITDEGQTETIALFSAAGSTGEPAPDNVNEMPAGLVLHVTANNGTPAVGDTVQYTLEPTGVTPSGNARPLDAYGFRYKYLYGVMQFVDGEWQFVIDPNNQVFQENNVFSFTFSSNNTYQLSFYIIEMYPTDDTETQFYSTSKSYTLNVTPTGTGQTVEEAADKVVAQCRAALPNGSQYDYALWLHDWILANCVYDYNGTGVLCGPEGVFFYGKGTCAAYRSAYEMLLNRVGIPNKRCTGNGHEWNAVRLDGKWYQIDVTWDDVDYSEAFSYYKHLYFGLTDELMRAVHSDHITDPSCPSNSLEQNYFIKTGQIRTWSNRFTTGITEQLKAGRTSFSLPVTTSEPDTTKRVLYGIAAYDLSTREWKPDNGKKYSLSAHYQNNALYFTAQEISVPKPTEPVPTEPVPTDPAPTEPVPTDPAPTEPKDYSLDNIVKLHSGKSVILCVDGADRSPDASGSFGGVTLAVGKDCLVTAYEYNLPAGSDVHRMYPTGMYVYKLERGKSGYSLKRLSALDNLLSYSGSSIRITGKKGIRMITSIEKSVKSALINKGLSGYTLEEYGTLLCYSSEIQNGSLSLSDSYARHNYAYSRAAGADPVFAYSGSKVQYTNVLVGFTNKQCKDDIAMRPYIILRGSDGKRVTLYGGTVHRSIGYIAYQNRNAFSPGTAAYQYIWDIIHYVYGNRYDKDYRG